MTTGDPRDELMRRFGSGGEVRVVAVPGRVNLIGEHIDYHGLPVLPMAIGRRVRVAFRVRGDNRIRAVSTGPYGLREFEWNPNLSPAAAGDWENYIRAAAEVVGRVAVAARKTRAGPPAAGFGPDAAEAETRAGSQAARFGPGVAAAETLAGPPAEWFGLDAAVVSDLPAAAGLSSSTALLVAFTLALLRANRLSPSFEALMEVLPDGEQFVGTRGGGMDHAAVLASCAGSASLIEFNPVGLRPIPIPSGWGFLIAHSLQTAEKSGGARQAYNARRAAGTRALERLGFACYQEAVEHPALAERLEDPDERDAFTHVTGEARRVRAAVGAMECADAAAFGRLLNESHASLRDRLKVSCRALDRLTDAALQAGALGARLTGAGFGGCAVVFCRKAELESVRRKLIEAYYAGRAEFDEDRHLIEAEPASGVLYAEKT